MTAVACTLVFSACAAAYIVSRYRRMRKLRTSRKACAAKEPQQPIRTCCTTPPSSRPRRRVLLQADDGRIVVAKVIGRVKEVHRPTSTGAPYYRQPQTAMVEMQWEVTDIGNDELVPWDGFGPRPTATPISSAHTVTGEQCGRSQASSANAHSAISHMQESRLRGQQAAAMRQAAQDARSRAVLAKSRLEQAAQQGTRSFAPRRTAGPMAMRSSIMGGVPPAQVLPHTAQHLHATHESAPAGGESAPLNHWRARTRIGARTPQGFPPARPDQKMECAQADEEQTESLGSNSASDL